MVKKKSNTNAKVVPEIKGNKAIQKNNNKKANKRFPSKATRGKKVNPFEFRTTSKSKRSDLKTTRDPSKINHSTLTRSRSQKKREETLGIEHSRRNIGNEFHDKRWGLKEDIPEEDRNLMLFQKQKMKEWREKEGGTARDDEILTHEGYDIDFEGLKQWREIEKDDDEEEEEEDTFGGLRRKLKSEMGEEEAITGKKSKELIMKEIIAKSKYYKFQRFQEKEEKNRKLSQVDDEFREVATLLGHGNLYFKKKQEEQANPEIQIEGAKEEKEGEKVEEGEEIEGDNSAEESENDQIEEGAAKEEERPDEGDAEQDEGDEEEEGEDKEQIVDAKEEGKAESEQEEEEDEGSGEHEEPKVEPVNDKKHKEEKPKLPKESPKPPEDDDDFDRLLREMTNEPRAQPTDPLQTPEELAKAQKEKLEQLELLRIRRMGEEGQPPLPGNQLPEETTSPTEGGDDLNDASLLVKNKYKKEKPKKKKSKKEKELERAEEEVEDEEEEEEDQQGESGEEESEEAFEEAEPTLPLTGDLPFVYEFPQQYSDFAALLAAQSIKRKQVIIKRIIACHHHSLNEENKSKMKILFGYLVEYLQKHSTQRSMEIPDRLELYDILHKAIYDLAHQIPAESSLFIRKKITQLFYKKKNLDFHDMILLQIIYHVWPASDRHHVIVTLVFLLFGKYFTETTFESEEDLLLGLFMATLFINYLKPAKRFAPEPYLFLCGIVKAFVENWKKAVYSAKGKDTQNTSSNDLPHDSVISKAIKSIQLDLVKIEDWSSLPQLEQIPTFNILSDFSKIEKDDSHKLAVLNLALVILKEYISIYNEEEQMIGFTPLLIQTLNLVKEIESITVLPKKIVLLLESIKKLASDRIAQASKHRIPLHLFDIPLKPLPEFTPDIKMEIGRNSRKKDPSKNAIEVNRLKRKLKSERKGAERELKLDAKFMARKRSEERKERDLEKTEKRRKVNTWLEDQQREAKKERREKKKSIF